MRKKVGRIMEGQEDGSMIEGQEELKDQDR